jgi:hypothetical protein
LSIFDLVYKIRPIFNKFGNGAGVDVSTCSTQNSQLSSWSLLLFLLYTSKLVI